MRKKRTELPGKPSELLALAINDFKELVASGKYIGDMTVWHVGGVPCRICLGGALIAKELGAPASLDMRDLIPQIARGNREKIAAVEFLRAALIVYAFTVLGLVLPSSLFDSFVKAAPPSYASAPKRFLRVMERRVALLAEAGF